MATVTASPPRLQKLPYHAWPTRFEKEQEAAGIDLGKQPNDLDTIGPWILGDMIGKGSSGRVKLGKHKYSGKMAAIKIISKNAVLTSKTAINGMDAKHQKALQGIHREIVIMKLINHPCIMALYDLQETENEFYLALEYVEGGELFDYLVSRGRLSEPEALNYFKQILFGLDYCHRFNISHRDLKPENILLDKHMNIKIADFGMAALEVANGMLETSCGSPHYASPEIVAGKAYHGASSDIWSGGVVLYALLTGRLPFDHPDIRKLLQKVKLGKFKMHDCLSPVAQDLIARMLVVDPEQRITIPQIFRHPFFLGPTNTIFINPPPPTLEDLSKPLGQYDHVDPAYLDNLQILFHKSRSDIERALRVRDHPNWEKAFLYLLRLYAERVRENYGEDDDDEDRDEYVPRRYGPPNTCGHPRFERDVFADITHLNGANARRSIESRPPVKLSVPPIGRKRSSTVAGPVPAAKTGGAKVQFAVPVVPARNPARVAEMEGSTRLVAIRAAPTPAGGSRIAEERGSRLSRQETRSSSHSREETRSSGHSREESGRRTRPPSVVGPRPNPPSPSKIGRPSSLFAPRSSSPANHHDDILRPVKMSREVPGSGITPRDRTTLPPQTRIETPTNSVFQDIVMGAEPTPFKSILSPDLDGTFPTEYVHVTKKWFEDGVSGSHKPSEERDVSRRSTLSPHAEPFILGEFGRTQPAKLVRKSKPSPLALANPNWQPVSSQQDTSGLESPKLGREPKVTGWFQNLFTFRPVFHVLYSTRSVEATHHECSRVLIEFGAALLKSDNKDMLRCHVERFIDLEGTIITKPVRFRVEIRSNSRIIEAAPSPMPELAMRSPALDVPGTPSPYPSVLTITQEKGAHSTLKAIYARLRASWRFDALVSPMPLSAGSAGMQTPLLG